MKTRNFLLTAAMMFLLAGCFVKSIHPFYLDNEVLLKKELLGTWTGKDSSVWKIGQGKKKTGLFKPDQPDNSYLITYTNDKGPATFSVHMFRLAGQLFLDFFPVEAETGNDLFDSHLVPAHTVARLDLTDQNLTIRWYDEQWLIGLFRENKIRIAHEKIPTGYKSDGQEDFQVILTAPTEDLQKFLLKYAADPEALSKDYTMVLRKKTRE